MKLIDGRALAEQIKDKIALEVFDLVKNGQAHPSLAIILVGNRPDSKLYVSLKEREAKKLGIDTHLYELEENVSEDEIIQTINFLNNDPAIDAILVQLPLPEHLDTDKIMEKIDPRKDADGFLKNHPQNVISPVFSSVKLMLTDININPKNLKAGILYNSEIFGLGLKEILLAYGFKEVVLAGVKDVDDVLDVDVLISAVGQPFFIKSGMIKKDVVLIDIGTTQVGNQVCGDVDFESVKDKASYISPVPGGVGPMTIAFLFQNVLNIYKNKKAA